MCVMFWIRRFLKCMILYGYLAILGLWVSFVFRFGNLVQCRRLFGYAWHSWYIKAVRTIGKLSLKIKINRTLHHFIIFIILIIDCILRAILCIN